MTVSAGGRYQIWAGFALKKNQSDEMSALGEVCLKYTVSEYIEWVSKPKSDLWCLHN